MSAHAAGTPAFPAAKPPRQGRRQRGAVTGVVRQALAVLIVVVVVFGSAPGQAQVYVGSGRGGDTHPESRRAGWATLLGAYVALGALATGGAYLLRDNFVGRGIAVTAGAWGGASMGAGIGYSLAQLAPCRSADCDDAQAVPIFLGSLLGGVAGSLIATWQTSREGMSRPTVTALGIAPFFLFASLGTVFDW